MSALVESGHQGIGVQSSLAMPYSNAACAFAAAAFSCQVSPTQIPRSLSLNRNAPSLPSFGSTVAGRPTGLETFDAGSKIRCVVRPSALMPARSRISGIYGSEVDVRFGSKADISGGANECLQLAESGPSDVNVKDGESDLELAR